MLNSASLRTLYIWLLLALPALSVPQAFADPLLNGVAVFQQLGKDRFIAGLYSDTLTESANDIIGSSQARSMELRITASSLSARRLNRLWIEGMAINNSADTLSQEAEHMVAFTKLVKAKLQRGDRLRLDYQAGQGTSVSVNGEEVGSIPGENFFDLLLRTWIGSIPLSSTFKNQLLASGDVEEETLTLYNSIAPAPERQDIVKQWKESEEKAKLAESKEIEAAKPKPKITPTAPSIATPTIAKPTIAKAPSLGPSPDINPPEPVDDASKPAPTAAEQTIKAKSNTESENAPKPTVAAARPSGQEEDDEEDEEVFTTEMLLERQRYHSQLLRWCYKYLKYPSKAAQRNQQGSVRIAVSIDRKGNIIEATAEEESPYRLLNKEALNAVNKANPFPPLPDSIRGEQYKFSLPIVFRLPD